MKIRYLTLACALIAFNTASCGKAEPNEKNVQDSPDVSSDAQNSDSDAGSGGDTNGADTGDSNDLAGLCDAQSGLALLDELIGELVADASWSFAHSSEIGRAYALSLPGVEAGSIGEASAAFPCTEAVDFDPYCEPEAEVGLTKCLRIGCESATVAYAETYFTNGGQNADATEAISYDAMGGTVNFPSQPIRRWRNDLAATDKTVSADLAADFTASGGFEQRFAYTGSVSTTESGGETTMTLTLAFEEMGGLGAGTLDVIHDDNTFTGTLSAGSATVQVSESGVDWSTCAD